MANRTIRNSSTQQSEFFLLIFHISIADCVLIWLRTVCSVPKITHNKSEKFISRVTKGFRTNFLIFFSFFSLVCAIDGSVIIGKSNSTKKIIFFVEIFFSSNFSCSPQHANCSRRGKWKKKDEKLGIKWVTFFRFFFPFSCSLLFKLIIFLLSEFSFGALFKRISIFSFYSSSLCAGWGVCGGHTRERWGKDGKI